MWVVNTIHNLEKRFFILVLSRMFSVRTAPGIGVIDTSTRLSDILDWAKASGDRSVQTAANECIVAFLFVSIPLVLIIFPLTLTTIFGWVGSALENGTLFQEVSFTLPNHGGILQSDDSVGLVVLLALSTRIISLWSARGLRWWNVYLPLEGPHMGTLLVGILAQSSTT